MVQMMTFIAYLHCTQNGNAFRGGFHRIILKIHFRAQRKQSNSISVDNTSMKKIKKKKIINETEKIRKNTPRLFEGKMLILM